MRKQTLTFTVAEIVAQRYSLQHAEAFVAMLSMTPPASQRQPKARPGKPAGAATKSRAADARLRRGASAARSTTPDPATVRAWAAGKGLKVGVTGRISANVLEAFLADGPNAVAAVNGDRARRMLTPR